MTSREKQATQIRMSQSVPEKPTRTSILTKRPRRPVPPISRVRTITPTKAEAAAIRRGRRDARRGRLVYVNNLSQRTAGRLDRDALPDRGAVATALATLQTDHYAGRSAEVKGHPNIWCRIWKRHRIFYELDILKGELRVLTTSEEQR
jgi:hypothetical protein